jgi:hypothetical protein
LAEAIAHNEFKVITKGLEADKSPKLKINDRFLKRGHLPIVQKVHQDQKKEQLRRYKI